VIYGSPSERKEVYDHAALIKANVIVGKGGRGGEDAQNLASSSRKINKVSDEAFGGVSTSATDREVVKGYRSFTPKGQVRF